MLVRCEHMHYWIAMPMHMQRSLLVIFSIPIICTCVAAGQDENDRRPTHYDETKVPEYTLPDPLVMEDGSHVATAQQWFEQRRPELIELFREHVYGRSPGRPKDQRFELLEQTNNALGGRANRKQVRIHLSSDPAAPTITLLIYTPKGVDGPRPAFMGGNFNGNHTIHPDPGIIIAEEWDWDRETQTEKLVKPDDDTRGRSSHRWPLRMILDRGYAVVTFPRADVEPDYAVGWKHGVRGYYLNKRGRDAFADDDWGAIAAWAWTLSRALDYLRTDSEIDGDRVAVFGHSRFGKTALWAAAEDERFAMAISNNSGAGGAALSRRCFGETVAVLNQRFPHWFCGNFARYNDKEDALPIDQHQLLALAAPRPLYIASATDDRWADPRGEFLAAKAASPVYELLGQPGLRTDTWPDPEQPVGETIGYHLRSGKHDLTEYDWRRFLDFADRHLRR